MSPRTRTHNDEAIFQATRRTIGRVGPESLTLADVGREIGLAPATLLQRFGSKRKLLLAYAGWRAKTVGGMLNELIDGVEDRVTVEQVVMTALEQLVDTSPAQAVINHFTFVHFALTDTEFRSRAAYQSREVVAALEACIQMLVVAKELRVENAQQLAHLVHLTMMGALSTWIVEQHGPVRPWVLGAVELVLAPYRIIPR